MLAACGPVLYVTPTGGDGILPVEAGRIVDAATATAAQMATQDALATATDESARATSTAAYRQTQDALSLRATDQALIILAGQATQSAQDTQDARQAAQAATHAAQTPTMAAMATQAVLQATQARAGMAQAADVAGFWATIRFIVAALLVVGGLTAIVIVAIDRISATRISALAAKAAIARRPSGCCRLAIGP